MSTESGTVTAALVPTVLDWSLAFYETQFPHLWNTGVNLVMAVIDPNHTGLNSEVSKCMRHQVLGAEWMHSDLGRETAVTP